MFVSEENENVWWNDGERIVFRTPNNAKILNAMRTQPTLTIADMKKITGISITAIQKLLEQVIKISISSAVKRMLVGESL